VHEESEDTHKGQGAATNREKGQGVTRTRAGAAPCKNRLARTLKTDLIFSVVHVMIYYCCFGLFGFISYLY
jgi:hypothetical protein